MGLEELTSYKWLVRGTGQVRNSQKNVMPSVAEASRVG